MVTRSATGGMFPLPDEMIASLVGCACEHLVDPEKQTRRCLHPVLAGMAGIDPYYLLRLRQSSGSPTTEFWHPPLKPSAVESHLVRPSGHVDQRLRIN